MSLKTQDQSKKINLNNIIFSINLKGGDGYSAYGVKHTNSYGGGSSYGGGHGGGDYGKVNY